MESKPINTHCPWSGDPVTKDATIQYRGHKVAFCNPGCRDKFRAAIEMFDLAIDQGVEPVLPPTDISEYVPRAMLFDQVLAIEGAQLKVYHIVESAGQPINEVVTDKAVAYVAEFLPNKIQRSGGDHQLGYVILHRGTEDHWLLMQWWAGGDICLSSLARLKSNESEFESADDTCLNACVWEKVITAHERDAWVRTMMTNDPSAGDYLADRLADGLY